MGEVRKIITVHMKKRIAILICFCFIYSCGGGEDETQLGLLLPSNPQPTFPTKIVLKGAINTKQDSLNFVHFLGEVENIGDNTACLIKITVDSTNSSGSLIDTSFTFVDGSPLIIFGITTDTCLRPGEFGGFEIFTILESLPSSFSSNINWDEGNFSGLAVKLTEVVIDGTITEDVNAFDNKNLKGFVKNLHSSLSVRFVEISFVAKKSGTVVATDFTFVNGSNCQPDNSTDTCLIPGERGSFAIDFDLPPPEITSYYYKISYGVIQ